MYIYGSFINHNGETVTVHIVTGNDRTSVMEIGTEEADVYFSDDPVEIASEVNDTFDVLLRQSAKIRLLCGNLIADFFSTSCRNAVVNIYRGSRCLFAGFIEPQTYSQPYNERWDDMELNCIDVPSGLQYSKYKDIGALGVVYEAVRKDAGQRTFKEILVEIAGAATAGLDITGGHSVGFWFDGSKSVDGSGENRYGIFSRLSISELLFLGGDEGSVWQQDSVVEEMLKFLNLHIAQDGLDFYIFSWETLRNGTGAIKWRDIITGAERTTERRTVGISIDNVMGCDTTISIGEVYNQLLLKCDIENTESVVESPLDGELLESPYSNKQRYMTEYSCDGAQDFAGVYAAEAFYKMLHGERTDYGKGAVTDWFVQVMRNKAWKFPMLGNTGEDLVGHFCGEGLNQQELPHFLGANAGACILSLGSVKMNTANDDNSPTSKVDMTNCLVLSVNGNGIDDDAETYPNEQSIRNFMPYAVYEGNSAGGVFSPADDETTNYIVFSGRIVLNPRMLQSGNYTELVRKSSQDLYNAIHRRPVPSRSDKYGRFYTRKYWRARTPQNDTEWHEGHDKGLCPYTGDGPEIYEFKYSGVGESIDRISKVAVLACMLVIGDKCVVEKTPDNDWGDRDASGNPIPYTDEPGEAYRNFVWRKYKTWKECKTDEEYYSQCFTLGFDPKIGDKIIGQEFDMQKTFSYKIGIDAEGTAVPIRKSDKVSGQVRFSIMGPVNATWNSIDKSVHRDLIFFRHTKWNQESVPVLANVSSIIVKSFEAKIYSDNGKVSDGKDDKDVIYMSDTKEKFVNRKDDLEFKITSALTAAECSRLGVRNSISMSTPLDAASGEGVREIHDWNTGADAKPEQIYVDSYYNEYHVPRIEMAQKLTDTDGIVSIFNHYRHDALGRDFHVTGISRNLMDGSADMKLKEVGK